MPAKRKHLTPNKDGPCMSESPYSKRPRRATANQSDLAQMILDTVKDYEDENNHSISALFLKLPSKRYNPDYYEEIVDPVDLNKIAQRIRMDEYRDIEILTTDFQLMISNAKKYYDEGTQEYIDACSLWEVYLNTKSRILEEAKSGEHGRSKPGRKDVEVMLDDLKEVYENLVTETDEGGRVIADIFMQLPDPSNTHYYDKIKEPIDFLMIGDRLEDGQYKTIADLEKDIIQLVKNAKVFNEKNSQIYEDAVTIKNIFREKVNDLEKAKHPEGTKTSARIKSRKSWGRVSERLQEKSTSRQEEMKSDLHEASIINPSEDDYQALYYNEIVNYKNQLGHTISDPFVRLPNKRFYPMYYDEIENPISLKIIRKKVQSKKYENCEEMTEDFNLLFSNATKFNVASSQIHKDALTLQKFMDSKLSEYSTKEEEDMVEESCSDEEKSIGKADYGSEKDNDETPKKRKRRVRKSNKETLQSRLQLLCNTLIEAEDEDGREMVTLFLEKPSRKDYPDYYKLVLEPIDMKMIDRKIRQDKYFSVDDMIEDFDLMFNNARHYNEPGSEVYSDADALEKLLLEKNKELGPLPEAEKLSGSARFSSSKKSSASVLDEKLKKLFTTVRDHGDPTQRMICEIFTHLPTKQELPDYYQIIKKPMEMDRIQQRMQTGQYVKLDEMLTDLLLMFENACIYNEPGSVIYKDALILQKVAVDTFYELEENDGIPSTEQLVHEMLISLYMSVMNHQDESGRCYSESVSHELAEDGAKDVSTQPQEGAPGEAAENTAVAMDTGVGKKSKESSKKFTFEIIKKNLHNRRYRRLDVFQEHMFEVFEEARSNNRTDSEIYEDAVELQKFFIKIRDELCKNGETLMSPALSRTIKRLENELEGERKEKLPLEAKEDEQINEEGKEMQEKMQMQSQSDKMDYQGQIYKPGDFVYVEDPDNLSTPHIVNIEKLYTDDKGERRLYGVWMYRPQATFHMASKKFFLKEVFRSDYYNTVPVSMIRGRCFVMFIKDYFKLKPVGFDEEDVYVCESRYTSKGKSFKRIKSLQWPSNDTEFVARETPLPVIRISSCFSDQKLDKISTAEKARSMLMHGIESTWPTAVIDKERENIEAEGHAFSEATHYIQYQANNTWIKLGDCVYLRQPNSSQYKIARIERLWTDSMKNVWFYGPWFIRPEDTEHEPTRMFYKNELFLNSEDTFLFSNVIGKCIVLYVKDYFACRPTEMPEKDIYLYESKYNESERYIKKIKGAKRYTPTHKVVDDEYYYFKQPLPVDNVLSPSLLKLVREETNAREIEAKTMKTKQEIDEASSSVSSEVQAYAVPHPNQPHMYAQGPLVQPYGHPPHMIPGQPYPHAPYPHHIVPTYPGSPSHADPHNPAIPHQPYIQQQQFAQGARYPLPGVTQQQMQSYQTSPHMYPPSPHPTMIAPSPGMHSPEGSRPSSARPEAAPTPPAKKKGRSGHSTGYILFASYYHPKVRSENPDMPFGEISKIVGEEWRHLDEDKKKEYEEKAREQTAKLEAEGRLISKKKKKKKDVEEPNPPTPQTPGQHPGVSTPQQYTQYQPGQYPHPHPVSGQTPMPQRMPVPQQSATPQQAYSSHNYPGAPSPMTSYVQTPSGQQAYAHQQSAVPTLPPPQPTIAQQHRMKRGPLFLKPPPKAQRVMHSEAYLRYIEGLERGSKSISNWEKTVKIQEKHVQLTKEEQNKLPVHWLANGKGRHESTTSALWALRDLMLKDALTIKNNFNL